MKIKDLLDILLNDEVTEGVQGQKRGVRLRETSSASFLFILLLHPFAFSSSNFLVDIILLGLAPHPLSHVYLTTWRKQQNTEEVDDVSF